MNVNYANLVDKVQSEGRQVGITERICGMTSREVERAEAYYDVDANALLDEVLEVEVVEALGWGF